MKRFLSIIIFCSLLNSCYRTQKESDQYQEQYSELELLVGRRCIPIGKLNPDRYEDPLSVILLDDKTMCGEDMIGAVCLTKFAKRDDHYMAQSSCSCRCENQLRKSDKNEENICTCPEDSVCIYLFDERIDSLPETLRGGYCFPKCLYDESCTTYCDPPDEDFEDNWEWECSS